MKKLNIVMLTLTAIMISGCDSVAEQPTQQQPTAQQQKIVFVVGNEPKQVKQARELKKVSAEVVSFGGITSNGVILTSKDFLSHIETVCLQVFIEGEYNPIFGKCSPVINGSYPAIEIDSSNIPNENFKAQIVGYKYQTNDWKSNYGIVLARTNTKVFEPLFVELGIEKVYMGDLNAEYGIELPMYIADSTNGSDFSDFSKITLISKSGYKQEYNIQNPDSDFVYARFFWEKNVEYSMFCMDNQCYNFPEKFDAFDGDLDIYKSKKVEMIPVNSGEVCSIKYNQDFHQVIDANKSYIFEHYVTIEDCNTSKYLIQVIVDKYEDLNISLSGDLDRYNIYESKLYPEQFTFNIERGNSNPYFFLQYSPKNNSQEGVIYYPQMTVKIVDEEGIMVQEETFKMTTFEFTTK